MGVVFEYPITVKVDNIGDILLSENTFLPQWTNNIDVRHKFIREYVEDRTLNIQFFHSEENLSDQFKKNLSNGPF